MPRIPIVVPQLGESIAEATIVAIHVNVGDTVERDQEIIDVETNKAAMSITTPCPGEVAELDLEVDQSYAVGSVLGALEVSEADAARYGAKAKERGHSADDSSEGGDEPQAGPSGSSGSGGSSPRPAGAADGRKTVAPTVSGLPVPMRAQGAGYLSPRMKARMHELGLHAADLAGIAGSGAGGRVTIEDFERFILDLERKEISEASSMRVAVADAMRRSWTRPIATVGMEVVLDPLLLHRKHQNPRPGPALYALRALAVGLGETSKPAGRLIGDRIVHPESIDIGVAVEAEDGVLVPVIREADQLPLMELVGRYNHLVGMARERRLPPGATGGSIATVTNFGTFGIVWATPIPLPEQTLVLGLGAGRKRPVWDDVTGGFTPTMLAELTLSFDHRVLDGGAAGRLLARIAELMQNPERL